MNKEFVPEEETKELYDLGLRHKKGFEALACYYGGGLAKLVTTHGLPAPTYSQAFRWFREKGYKMYVTSITLDSDKNYKDWTYSIYHKGEYSFVQNHRDGYLTYEEAELECLRKLIEIVNGRNTKSNT